MDVRLAYVISIGLCCGLSANAHAQIAIDTTLGTESSELAPRSAGGTQIQGGAVRGESLFHSFAEFNVNAGEQVFFANPANIEMIVGRVTGNDVSDIFGRLGVDGTASLYLLNPNGFLFGPDARLDIPGSFFASTATSLDLGDGVEFSAIAPAPVPMLMVSVPLGLQPGRTFAGDIVSRSEQLRVGGSLGLAASTIELQGGQILQSDGDIHIQAIKSLEVRGSNTVGLPSWIATGFAPSTGGTAGDILIETGRLVLEDGGLISTLLFEEGEGGDLIIWSEESVELRGQSPLGSFSFISAGVDSSATGNAGNIIVNTSRLVLEDGAQISSVILGEGNAGNVEIRANELVELRGKSEFSESASAISTRVRLGATGNAGDLLIETERLVVEEEAVVFSSVLAEGNGGSLTIRADESVELREGLILSAVELGGMGNAGELLIETGRLILEDGSVVSSSTSGQGNGGTLTVRADEAVELRGQSSQGRIGQISTSVFPSGVGDAGDLTVETGQLLLTGTSIISTDSSGIGDAGDLEILAENWILVSGNSILGAPTLGSGTVGSTTLVTEQLTVQDNGLIVVSALSNFPAGALTINADLINLSDSARLEAKTTTGDDGSITLNTRGILLRDNSSISTDATGVATGGNIVIDASDFVLLLGDSRIDARAVSGQGGNIDISTSFFVQSDNSRVDASSDLGVDGSVSLNTPEFNPVPDEDALPTSFVNVAVDQRCVSVQADSEISRFVQTGRGGLASDADAIDHTGLWVDMRSNVQDLSVSMPEQSEVDTTASASPAVANKIPDPIIEAQGWSRNSSGQVVLTAAATTVMPYSASSVASSCLAG